MIKAIIFDCFGVLTGDKWKEFVATLPEDQKSTARDLNHALDAGFLTQSEFYKKITALTGVSPVRVESVINAELHKNKPLLDYISELKKSYKIGILSNISSSWITDFLLTKEEALLFDDILLSYQVGMTKPNPAIFHIAAERLGVQPSECIFIDDGTWNCESAKNVGMKPVVYTNFVQCRHSIQQLLN